MIDLNKEPAENNDDPLYCTQHAARNAEFVAESPNPRIIQRVDGAATEAMETDGQSSHGVRAPGSTQVPAAIVAGSDDHTLDGIGAAGDTGGTVGNGLGANDDEAWSQPKEPYMGMRFDTLEDAKVHYNAYSMQMGFSIKMNSSRKDLKTRELIKQQFVCNKFRKPDVDDGGVEKIPVLDDIVEQAKDDNEDEAIVFFDDDSKGKKRSKKRKRDKIVQTGCKKMIVKVIDGRWEVIYFVSEHNHPLVEKPYLTKYLRSHQGIPPEERAFLTHLHNCNLTTGRMMHIMSDFYGTELIVPYDTKHIKNLKTLLNKDDTKEGDMIETVAYFKDQQREDPDFFYKIKYDEEDRIENIFWVDGAARKAYVESCHDCISFDTTYMTNMYNMPFAPFIGINRHGQSFMLGCGFVRQELAS
uniref:Protein FAR1-RELATED SEQUENCE n=2 Tax=Triticum urartu TaxID=4572 RepID=A0A8R7PK14_TRIUA